jgi:hypothetical protein
MAQLGNDADIRRRPIQPLIAVAIRLTPTRALEKQDKALD